LFGQDRKSFSSDQSTMIILLIIIRNIFLEMKAGTTFESYLYIPIYPFRMTSTDTATQQDF